MYLKDCFFSKKDLDTILNMYNTYVAYLPSKMIFSNDSKKSNEVDYVEIPHEEFKKMNPYYRFNINTINKLDDILISNGWKSYKSIEHHTMNGKLFRSIRNLKDEICITYLPKKIKISKKLFTRSDTYCLNGVDYEPWDFNRKLIDTIEINKRWIL